MNCTTRAYHYLEHLSPGSYATLIRHALEHNGIIHAAPDCFCIAIPDTEDPRTVHILFQCSHLPSLWRLARMYRHQFTHVKFRRDFKNNYPERRLPIDLFLRKTALVNTLLPPDDSPQASNLAPCTL